MKRMKIVFQLFAPFGEVDLVDLHKDPYTMRSKGYAFVQFRKAVDAKEAMTAMNGVNIAAKELRVSFYLIFAFFSSDLQVGILV